METITDIEATIAKLEWIKRFIWPYTADIEKAIQNLQELVNKLKQAIENPKG